jgi:nucleotide-binding universal stress UspA family protein
MLRELLVAVDGSSFSEHALPYAVDTARRSGARLHLVHVHEPIGTQTYADGVPVFDERWNDALRTQEKDYLESLAYRCMEHGGVTVVTELLDGAVSASIAAYAAEVGIDLIVMTTHGRGGISRAWVGSVADALVRRASVPVLLLRPKDQVVEWNRGSAPKHMLIPLDGSELAEGILAPALDLARLSEARVTLLRIVLPVPFVIAPHAAGPSFDEIGAAQSRESAAQHLNRVAGLLRSQGTQVATDAVFHTVPALGILDYAATHAVDIIAMATRGRGGWSRVALGSVADKVMRGTTMPVLLHRPPARRDPRDAEAADPPGNVAAEEPCTTS